MTLRSIGNWERGSVPGNREARLRDVLGDHLTPGGNPLAQASDLALITELARRLDQRGKGADDAGYAEAEKIVSDPVRVTTRAELTTAARPGASGVDRYRQSIANVGEESQDMEEE